MVGIITPWNFPIAIPAWKMAPALICGNALVFKPASSTPLCAVKLAEVFEEAGLPPGVLNLITGPGALVGNALVEDTRVNGISFTGSTEIGTDLYGNGAKRLKKVQAEMGGKNAVILLADADMDKALGGIVQGAFGSTGQRCTATSRVIVEESVYDEFVESLLERTGNLRIGDGIDPDVDVSPLCGQGQYDKVLEYIGIGAEEGANLAYGGRGLSGGEYDDGYYVEPTVFTDVSPDMRIAKEEIFGPVLTVFKAKDLEEAIQISNSVEFGLSSSVYTRDLTPRLRVHQHRRDRHGPRQRADLGRRGSSALRRTQVVGRRPARARHRSLRLLHRNHHSLHRPRRSGPATGPVYLRGEWVKSSGNRRRTFSIRGVMCIVATPQRMS